MDFFFNAVDTAHKSFCLWLADNCWLGYIALSDDAFGKCNAEWVDASGWLDVDCDWNLANLGNLCGSIFSSLYVSRLRFWLMTERWLSYCCDNLFILSLNEVLLAAEIFEMDRSRRRGGENRARFDFSMRHVISDATATLADLSCVGLINSARFDVSRDNIFGLVADPLAFRPLFFNELGVLRPKNK